MSHPLNIGEHVRIIHPSDDMVDPRYVGHTGVVVQVATGGLDIGESATDPAVVVRFDRPLRLRNRDTSSNEDLPGFLTHDEDAFWPEELMPWV